MRDYREWDFCDISLGHLSAIILYDGEIIHSFSVPMPTFGDGYEESKVEDYYSFEFEDCAFNLSYISSNVGVYISLECDMSDESIDMEKLTVELISDENDDELGYSYETKRVIMCYVPAMGYTNTTSSILYDIKFNVIPLLDIDKHERFENYCDDALIINEEFPKHFLDLNNMLKIINLEEINVAKAENIQLRLAGKKTKDLPERKYAKMDYDEILKLFAEIPSSKTSLIIPTYLIDDTPLDNLPKFLESTSNFQTIAIRVERTNPYIQTIQQIFTKCTQKTCYVILDMGTNYEYDVIAEIISQTKKYIDESKIIFLSSNFTAQQISIKQDDANRNIIKENMTLETYFKIKLEYPDIIYGDYCGFDRKTLTEQKGRPTARVILCSLSQKDKILIRRGFDPKDVVKLGDKYKYGYSKSMIRLLGDIYNGKIDYEDETDDEGNVVYRHNFLDVDLCDADGGLKSFGPVSTTPGKIKMLCLRHNILSVLHKFF